MSSYEPLLLEQTSSKNGFDSFLESAQLCYLLHINPSEYPEPNVADAMPLHYSSCKVTSPLLLGKIEKR